LILVAGASGLVGRATVEVLQSGRRPWIELSRRPAAENASEGPRTVVACDATDAAALARAVPEARSIVHLAGVAPGAAPAGAAAIRHEVAAMRALVELARARRSERFVFLSATGAARDAGHPWLRAKGEAEALLRASGVPFVILRASLVYGVDSPVMHALMQVVRAEVKLRLPLLRAGRLLPIAVGDAAIALATALDHHRMAGETIELGAPPEVGLESLLELVARRLGKKVARARLPFAGHRLADALAQVPVAPLADAAGFVRLFAVLEPPALAAYDRLVPMRRTDLAEELRRFPWGAPPPRPGDPLPTLAEAPSPGLPLIIPGPSSRSGGPGTTPPPSWFGRTDEYGRVEGRREAREADQPERGEKS
jgi:NADH dehydrogenase